MAEANTKVMHQGNQMRYHVRRYPVQKYLPKVLSSGKTLTYPRNTTGKDKRKDIDKGENDHITEESQLSKERESISNTKEWVERAFTANENSMEDQDKNQELCVSDVQPDGAVPVEDMHKTELHSIVAKPTELDMNSKNKAPQMEDMWKGGEHEELGERLLVQSQSELPNLAIESDIQSYGPVMVSVDDKGVG
ncbi:hypothetical protein K7X08_011755 [Anisodus acutangulus]|uniref:Uncharacterized protein n=1 Tax=Anisodus acutangulus TaxID=402998 RepID=A0A9Q1MLB7_9SOLA|nr:hypothetical protein K7X08_011755 [Anisodus acutangulus]